MWVRLSNLEIIRLVTLIIRDDFLNFILINEIDFISMIKIVLLGDKSVGKTSIINAFLREKFDSAYKSTTG